MTNKQLDIRMDELMSKAKAIAKEISGLVTGLKKKDRDTVEYNERIQKASALQKE